VLRELILDPESRRRAAAGHRLFRDHKQREDGKGGAG
jgi:hypothetical protein